MAFSLLCSFAAALATMLALDGAWLMLVARQFYARQIGHLMANEFSMWPVALFYIIYIGALIVFVVHPAVQSHASLWSVARLGALFGVAAYATYDLTNLATLRAWPIAVTVVDLAWGMVLTGTVAVVAVLVARAVGSA